MQRTMTDFFEWLMARMESQYVIRLRDEYERMPYRICFALGAHDPKDWPLLWDAYDERVALMCEDRQPEDDDLLAAWEQVLGIGRYQKKAGGMVMAAGGPWQFTEEDKGGTND